METFVYFLLTAVWWIASFSVLLPFSVLMLFSTAFRDKWLSFIFPKVLGPFFRPKIAPMRKQLFTLLEEHLSKRSKSVPLKILEIGIGTGGNLQFYPENSYLTALDMDPSFVQVLNKNRVNYPQVNMEDIVINYAEDMKDISSDAFDVVVCSHVLCSVKSIDSVMEEVKRVLKPGGKFLFLEHVAFPKHKASYFVQSFANPLWKLYVNGCCVNRNTAESIKNSGFKNVYCEVKYFSSMPLLLRPQVFGIATK